MKRTMDIITDRDGGEWPRDIDYMKHKPKARLSMTYINIDCLDSDRSKLLYVVKWPENFDTHLQIIKNDELQATLPLHSEFLVKKIPYFEKMFNSSSPWKESKVSEQQVIAVKYEHDNIDAVKAYFECVYTGSLKIYDGKLTSVLKIADYFGDVNVVAKCADYIEHNLTEELLPAAWESGKHLETAVIDFLKNTQECENCGKDTKESVGYRSTCEFPYEWLNPAAFINNMKYLSFERFKEFVHKFSTNDTLYLAVGVERMTRLSRAWYLHNENSLDNWIYGIDWSSSSNTNKKPKLLAEAIPHLTDSKIKAACEYMFSKN